MGSRPRTVLLALAVVAMLIVGVGAASAQAPDYSEAPAAGDGPDVPALPLDPGTGEGGSKHRGGFGDDAQSSKVSLRLHGLRKGRLPVGHKFKVNGTLNPFAKGERVTVILFRGNKAIKHKTMTVKQKRKKGSNLGQFAWADKLVKPGRYSVQAVKRKSDNLGGSKDRTRKFQMKYPSLHAGNRGPEVALFNRLLENLGYVNDKGHSFDSATGRAVLAYRKVNGMSRNEKASSGIYKKLADGRGGYKLHHPGAGKHVEADLSRQVMVLAKHGKVDEIYHISSGAPATPTITGHFQFYRKEPGTNSHGMVNSVYFQGGYATHGYASVPDYPASHGCLRNPIPDSGHIYNWIDLGDDIWVYR